MLNNCNNFVLTKNKAEIPSYPDAKLGRPGTKSSNRTSYVGNLLMLGILMASIMVNNSEVEAATVKTQQTPENLKAQENIDSQPNETVEYFNPFEQLSKDMDSLWHKIALRDKNGYILDGSFISTSGFNSYLNSNDKEYVLNIEIPGFEKEQVKIELHGEHIIIKAQKADTPKKDNSYEKPQFRNSFYQKLVLPKDANKNAITTSLKNGVLTIILPKSPVNTEEIKTIPIG